MILAATICPAQSDAEILSTHSVMFQLRPAIERESYVAVVRRLMDREGYRIVALVEDGRVAAVAGYRFMEMLYCGRVLYIDDLVTEEAARSRGHGGRLLEWLREVARERGCAEVHLDSRLHREAAHRFYEREGFTRTCYHFAASL